MNIICITLPHSPSPSLYLLPSLLLDKGTSSQPFVSQCSSTPQSLTGTSGISSWRSNESTLRDPSVNMR